ncbi:granulocyte-macrophage colony-stimulating factor receptor subunit alpha-like [Leptodactylus fuscus]|uniref:granulocyte-macrophage colony-stimulating factor receptor subunit alpha-like n=1 Tax=Leptodactylus fuscus TaxID=238119 RepID=UPI003F4E4556
MVHSSCLVFLFFVWFPLKTLSNEDNTAEDENNVPLLQDFKVNITPGFINITWNCNITKSMEKYQYKVILQHEHPERLNVKLCSFVFDMYKRREFILHKGIAVQLLAYRNSKEVYKGEVVEYMPEGKKNSAAENISCIVHSAYILNCSWSVGKEAPEDIQYFFALRQKESLKCQDYRTDSFGRHVGCVMKKPNITLKLKAYLEVTGLSNETSIQFLDDIYDPIQHAILDPPRNITLMYNSDELEIKWEKPETLEVPGGSCFTYKINIKDKKEIDIVRSEKNVYKITEFHQNEKIIVTMRVKWDNLCSYLEDWSDWSEPHVIGNDSTQLTTHHILAILGGGTAIILILIIFMCYRFRIWNKLFPQVPRPSMKLFEQVEQKEKSVQKFSEFEIPLTAKDEDEFIHSYVTEMPEKF